jgi:hypothetical protein
MNIEVHAPSQLLLVVSLVLIVLAVLLCFFVNTAAAFWIALAAYLVMGLGTNRENVEQTPVRCKSRQKLLYCG